MCDRQSVGLRGMLKDSRWWYASVCRAESGKKMKTHSCVSDRRELSAGSREDVVGLTSLGSRMVWLDGHLSLLSESSGQGRLFRYYSLPRSRFPTVPTHQTKKACSNYNDNVQRGRVRTTGNDRESIL